MGESFVIERPRAEDLEEDFEFNPIPTGAFGNWEGPASKFQLGNPTSHNVYIFNFEITEDILASHFYVKFADLPVRQMHFRGMIHLIPGDELHVTLTVR